MEHLSGLDGAFLYLESPETPMHVGALNQIELPTGYDGDYFQDVRRHVAGRLHLADVFRRRLAPIPLGIAAPAWVEDGTVDLDHHLREVVLPRPGTDRQLEQMTARLHAGVLDRTRPLWQFHLIRGLASGRVGFYTKVHHAGIDGQAGVALAHALLDPAPAGRPLPPSPPPPSPSPSSPTASHARSVRPPPGGAELAQSAIRLGVRQYASAARQLPGLVRSVVRSLAGETGAGPGAGAPSLATLRDTFRLSPRTPFNVSIGGQRAFAARSVPLADVKRAGRRLGVSLNDMVLAACAGALRRYLLDLQALPPRALTAGVPFSLREAGDDASNNQVSMTLVSLATDIADPVRRLRAIARSTRTVKGLAAGLRGAPLTTIPSLGTPWLLSGLAVLYGRTGLANRLPGFASLAISNVPGPPAPLYLAGARILTYTPVSIVTHGLALNITAQSYAGALDVGLIACQRAVPDITRLGDLLVQAFAELAASAGDAGGAPPHAARDSTT